MSRGDRKSMSNTRSKLLAAVGGLCLSLSLIACGPPTLQGAESRYTGNRDKLSAIITRKPQAKAEIMRYARHRISRIVWTEIMAGEPIEKRDIVRDLISAFDVVEVDARIAMAAADIRYRMRMKLMDAYILATAQVNGAILITRNTRDFPAEMPGIRMPYTL